MKAKLNIKSISSILSATGLILLLMLAPCKVREYIEYKLDLPQSEVVNKSQTSLSNTNCASFENTKQVISSSKSISKSNFILATNYFNNALNIVEYSTKKFHFQKSRNLSISITPYYILYRNFKVYL